VTLKSPFIKDFLQKSFDIREGEYQRVFLMQLNIFLIICTLLVIKPVVNARFLTTIGIDKLPLLFILVAAAAMIVSSLYSSQLRKYALEKVIYLTLGISIFGLILIAVLLHFSIAENLVIYGVYIGVSIFGVLATSQFWIMANLAFDAREAKRLFGFIGAGAIAGGVAGGYLTSVLAEVISSTNLLLVGAGLLSLCVPVNAVVWKKHITQLSPFQKSKRYMGFGDHPLWLIKKSSHLTNLALLVAIGVIVSKLVEFEFSSLAIVAIPDPDELAAFFGFWFSTFNVISLLLQLLATRRVVGTYGVGSSLFVLPAGIFVGSLLLLMAPVLWVGIFIKLWDVSVKQSINKSAFELLALPIPSGIKGQTKSFIDVFVDLAATGVAGLLLIFLVNGLNLSVRWVGLLTLAIVAVWVLVALRVRSSYITSFKAVLSASSKQNAKPKPDLKDASVLSSMKQALEEGSELQILFMLGKVDEISDKRFFENVEALLHHSSYRVRAKALQVIYNLRMEVDSATLKALLLDAEFDVRVSAFAQLIRQNPQNRASLISKYLTSDDVLLSGAALVGLAQEARGNEEMKKQLHLAQRISEKLDYVTLSESEEEKRIFKTMAIRAIGAACSSEHYPYLIAALKDSDGAIVAEAIRSAGRSMHSDFIPHMVPFLVPKLYRKEAEKALRQFGKGVVPILSDLALDPNTKPDLIQRIPSVLEELDAQEAVKALLSFLDSNDVLLRLESLRALNTMKQAFPNLKIQKEDIVGIIINESKMYKITLGVLYKQNEKLNSDENATSIAARQHLLELIERRLDGTLERIFRLIGLRYPPEDVIQVYNGIKSVDRDVRMSSVEFLDNLLEPSLKKTLIPIAESAWFERISEDMLNTLNVEVPSQKECLELLLKGRDVRLKMAVFRLLEALDVADLNTIVVPLLDSPVDKVREGAQRLLGKG
jgi:AAA family ATP:ADP antiporter